MLHSQKLLFNSIRALKKLKKNNIWILLWLLKGGFKLINEKAIKTLREKLMNKVYIITPNIPEAEVLTKTKIKSLEDMIHAANILLKLGVRNVLIKAVTETP